MTSLAACIGLLSLNSTLQAAAMLSFLPVSSGRQHYDPCEEAPMYTARDYGRTSVLGLGD